MSQTQQLVIAVLKAMSDFDRRMVTEQFCNSCACFIGPSTSAENCRGWCISCEPDECAHHGEDA